MSIPISIFKQMEASDQEQIKSSMILSLIGDLQYTTLPLHQPAESILIIDMTARVA